MDSSGIATYMVAAVITLVCAVAAVALVVGVIIGWVIF